MNGLTGKIQEESLKDLQWKAAHSLADTDFFFFYKKRT